ncbi:MAG: bifunctional (p)ppGpp synthetase/guanosine-3',5'-bis(diphosphate) 3'-pyrophosphohydrolase, partial [Firmicutes bacterium]|nr:bifunctional (p)ppGpp synthetase/guanosine-3',5'-bis(diphosphate) 3'-pyrophosphohydrolase [Bacillota bacterium]
TVIGDSGKPFEIQIRTYEMHRIAEYGIAAHWKYKEGVTSDKEEVKLSWLRQALEWQKDVKDPKEFMESLKMDLFSSQVFVFTPQGDVIELPAGATPLDFAFKIHSDVGCKCVGAKVNGKMVTIDHTLENGNIIEIVTSPNAAGPSIDWLKIAKSSSARNKIRQWLKKENKTDTIDKGKDQIDRYIRKKGYDPRVLLKNNYVNKAVKEMGFKNSDELYNQLSYGGTIQTKLVNLLLSYDADAKAAVEAEKERSLLDNLNEISEKAQKRNQQKKKQEDNSGVIVEGLDNLMIRMSGCCNPVPGDEIIGFITKGRGISVHRKDCDNLKNLPEKDKGRCIAVSWDPELLDKSFNAEITLTAKDQKGLFSNISKVCEDMDVNILGLNARADKNENVNITLTLSIKDRSQIEKMCRSFKSIPGILEAYRSRA